MATKELLLVLVKQIFNDQETSDVVHQSVLHSRMELNCIRIRTVVTERVIHFNHLRLALLRSWLLHRCDVSRSGISLLCTKDA